MSDDAFGPLEDAFFAAGEAYAQDRPGDGPVESFLDTDFVGFAVEDQQVQREKEKDQGDKRRPNPKINFQR